MKRDQEIENGDDVDSTRQAAWDEFKRVHDSIYDEFPMYMIYGQYDRRQCYRVVITTFHRKWSFDKMKENNRKDPPSDERSTKSAGGLVPQTGSTIYYGRKVG